VAGRLKQQSGHPKAEMDEELFFSSWGSWVWRTAILLSKHSSVEDGWADNRNAVNVVNIHVTNSHA
jgi:hypothetical protein